LVILEDSVEIKTSAEKLFYWLIHLPENYKDWHSDHGECRWLKGGAFEEGSVLYVEEYLHGELHKFKFKTVKNESQKRIDYRPSFPHSLFFQMGSFIIEPKGDQCVFTATMCFRFGRLLSKLARSRLEALKKHLREEGENLKMLLEKQ
jgi:hypothetical protein